MSLIKANNITNVTGGIPTVKSQQLIPTAWVNFNGTGTVAIRDSENVSSITDNGTGQYTVNFSNNMANANYAPSATQNGDLFVWITNLAVGSYSIRSYSGSAYADRSEVTSTVMGGQA